MPEIVADNISIIRSDELEGALRIDSRFYTPDLLKIRRLLANSPKLFSKSRRITDFGAYSQTNFIQYKNSGVRFLRNQDIEEIIINDSDKVFIDQSAYEKLSLKLEEGDVVLPRVGTLGKSAVITKDILPCSANQNLAQIKTKNDLSPYYLSVFLSTQFGLLQISALATGNVQPWLNLNQIGNIKVFLPNDDFQKTIETLCALAIQKDKMARIYCSQAEALLLEELGIKDIDLSHEPCYEVNSADVINSNRIDAEYYQPKYERVVEAIKKHLHKSIGDMFRLIKGIEPGSSAYCEEGKPFIRVSNLNKFEINSDNQQYLSEKTYSELKANYQPLKGEILLAKDATPGIAYHLKEPLDGIISSGILRLQALSNIKKEYICLVINSIVGQSQIKRDSGGSVINHWKPSQVQKTLIPILPDKIQEKIELLCLESHFARRRAKELLENAKRKVEEMIEKDSG